MDRKLTIIHPSYGRPSLAYECYKNWMGNAKYPEDIRYILSVYSGDESRMEYSELFTPEAGKMEWVINDRANMVEQINNAIPKDGDIFIVVSDDFISFPDWDVELLNEVYEREDFVLKTVDGIQPDIITLPIMDRKYYDRFGYVFHPDYKHLYCDNELYEVSKKLNRLIYSDLEFKHNHYSVGGMEMDEVDKLNDSYYNIDYITFIERSKRNFDL